MEGIGLGTSIVLSKQWTICSTRSELWKGCSVYPSPGVSTLGAVSPHPYPSVQLLLQLVQELFLHQRRKRNFSLKHRTSRVVLFNEINDETGCKLTEACRMENGTVIFNALMVTTCDIIKGIMTLLYHHGIDFHKWSVHICIISLHVMYQLISVAYILNIYIYTHISIKALSILSARSSCHSPTGTLSAFFEPPRWTTLAQRNRHTGRKSVAKAHFLNVMRRNHAKIGPNGWTQSQVKQCNDTGMLAIVFDCITQRSHFRRTLTLFRLPLEKTPLLVKYMSNWRELAEPFPNCSWQLFLFCWWLWSS